MEKEQEKIGMTREASSEEERELSELEQENERLRRENELLKEPLSL